MYTGKCKWYDVTVYKPYKFGSGKSLHKKITKYPRIRGLAKVRKRERIGQFGMMTVARPKSLF